MRDRSRALARILVSEGSMAESEALIKNRLEKGLVKEELVWLASICKERTDEASDCTSIVHSSADIRSYYNVASG